MPQLLSEDLLSAPGMNMEKKINERFINIPKFINFLNVFAFIQ
jgi:hypothetical protein